jgi:hypothetical protein
MLNPFKIITSATKAVPFVKYALGIAGIVALIAIIKALDISIMIAFWGTVVTLFLMFILFLLAKLSQSKTEVVKGPAIFLMWAIVILFILTVFCLFSSVFFRKPLNLTKWIDPDDEQIINPKDNHSDSLPNKKDVINYIDTVQRKKPMESNTEPNHLPITLSIQLNSKSDGYQKILLNGREINVLPESTTYNPRIELESKSINSALIIITKSGDTCLVPIPKKNNSSVIRIIPNCSK